MCLNPAEKRNVGNRVNEFGWLAAGSFASRKLAANILSRQPWH